MTKTGNSFRFQHAKTICKAKCVQRDFVLFYHTSLTLHYLKLKDSIGYENKIEIKKLSKVILT